MGVIAVDTTAEAKHKSAGFRWPYIVLPVAVWILAVVFIAVLYGSLPDELAYRFSTSQPDRLMARGAVLTWTLVLVSVFALLSCLIVLVMTSMAQRLKLETTPLVRGLFGVIGNVMVLPQLIIAYAAVDIFLYNIYRVKLLSLLAFSIIVMAAGGIVLAVIFTRSIAQVRKHKKTPQEIK